MKNVFLIYSCHTRDYDGGERVKFWTVIIIVGFECGM